MSNPLETTWGWVKTAPLPVVMSLVFILGAWVYAVEEKANDAKTKAEVAVEGKRDVQRKLERMEDKIDKLLEAVVASKVAQEEKDKKDGKKDKKKVEEDNQ